MPVENPEIITPTGAEIRDHIKTYFKKSGKGLEHYWPHDEILETPSDANMALLFLNSVAGMGVPSLDQVLLHSFSSNGDNHNLDLKTIIPNHLTPSILLSYIVFSSRVVEKSYEARLEYINRKKITPNSQEYYRALLGHPLGKDNHHLFNEAITNRKKFGDLMRLPLNDANFYCVRGGDSKENAKKMGFEVPSPEIEKIDFDWMCRLSKKVCEVTHAFKLHNLREDNPKLLWKIVYATSDFFDEKRIDLGLLVQRELDSIS